MASLTHVCMWSDNGWKRITAEQAARLHSGGTVSARSGLFMCELCGQYVTLTDGDINVRYPPACCVVIVNRPIIHKTLYRRISVDKRGTKQFL